MMAEPKQWVARVVNDLIAISDELLAPGIGGSKNANYGREVSPLFSTTAAISTYCAQIPLLLSELEGVDSRNVAAFEVSPIPKQGLVSRNPAHYMKNGNSLIPSRWLRPISTAVLPEEPLRWLVGVGERLGEKLAIHQARLEKQVEVAKYVREGTTTYAIEDLAKLDKLLSRLTSLRRQLSQARVLIGRKASRPIKSSDRIPSNIPRSPAWQRFRRMAAQYDDQRSYLGGWLKSLESQQYMVADHSFLYQRWCGLQIVLTVQKLGWTVSGDIVGALFLGGSLQITQGSASVEMWIEPRLSQKQAERIGWAGVNGQELTPDFLFVCGAPGARDAFVLDATLSANEQFLLAKGRYRDLLIGVDESFVAGVPVQRIPVRSWAIAPIKSMQCQLGDPMGYSGTVPADALQDDFSGLSSWISDVLAHAVKSVG